MLQVHKRDGFSDRYGIKPENHEIQLGSLDKHSRVQLSNKVTEIHNNLISNGMLTVEEEAAFSCYIMGTIYSVPVNRRDASTWCLAFDQIKSTILEAGYDDVLTVIEAIAQFLDQHHGRNIASLYRKKTVYRLFNEVFENEYIGYRFIGNSISPIRDKQEIHPINEALGTSKGATQEHIEKAVALLSDRNKPDYENSIKESISAVEAICEVLLNTKGKQATLGAMIKKLEDNEIVIHGALKEAFNKLYGYTNDANGIRHAGDIGGPSSTFEEAKFMLVACCAFINYLKGVKAKIQ